MKTIIHRAESRGTTTTDWLNSRHSFSFGEYYDPNRVRFGALRVLNDDVVAPGAGFGTHPHRDMEIVTIPLSGALEHKDSTGATGVLRPGRLQVMSAGTGIFHSEYNHSKTEAVSFLQIWILPSRRGLTPRYDEKDFSALLNGNGLLAVVSPDDSEAALRISQNARFSLGRLDAGSSMEYRLGEGNQGLYAFIIDGVAQIGEETLSSRDGIGITETEAVAVDAVTSCQFLLIEVPMD
ncbi:MAG: pirin family protein [Candidatus Hydrogenedentes bacterium]|nr:pirin family protein [Candidatus Hydrogenedentota bacterium]